MRCSATLVVRANSLGIDISKHIKSKNLFLRQVDAAELSPGQFVHEIRDLVEKHDLKLLVIDSLNGFLNAMPGEQFLAMQLHEMLGLPEPERRGHAHDHGAERLCRNCY